MKHRFTGLFGPGYIAAQTLAVGSTISPPGADAALPDADTDARAMANTFHKYNPDRKNKRAAVIDPSGSEFLTLLEQLTSRENCTSTTRIFFYFSGHGIRDDKGEVSFLLGPEEKSSEGHSLVSFKIVEKMFRECRAGTIIVILDCCHSGAFEIGYNAILNHKNINSLNGGYGRVLMGGAGEEEAHSSLGGKHGAFTERLIQGWQNGLAAREGLITTESLIGYIEYMLRFDGRAAPCYKIWDGSKGPIVIDGALMQGKDLLDSIERRDAELFLLQIQAVVRWLKSQGFQVEPHIGTRTVYRFLAKKDGAEIGIVACESGNDEERWTFPQHHTVYLRSAPYLKSAKDGFGQALDIAEFSENLYGDWRTFLEFYKIESILKIHEGVKTQKLVSKQEAEQLEYEIAVYEGYFDEQSDSDESNDAIYEEDDPAVGEIEEISEEEYQERLSDFDRNNRQIYLEFLDECNNFNNEIDPSKYDYTDIKHNENPPNIFAIGNVDDCPFALFFFRACDANTIQLPEVELDRYVVAVAMNAAGDIDDPLGVDVVVRTPEDANAVLVDLRERRRVSKFRRAKLNLVFEELPVIGLDVPAEGTSTILAET